MQTPTGSGNTDDQSKSRTPPSSRTRGTKDRSALQSIRARSLLRQNLAEEFNYSNIDSGQVLEAQQSASCIDDVIWHIKTTPRFVFQLLAIAFAICIIGLVAIKFGESDTGKYIVTTADNSASRSGLIETENGALLRPTAQANVSEIILRSRQNRGKRTIENVVDRALHPSRHSDMVGEGKLPKSPRRSLRLP